MDKQPEQDFQNTPHTMDLIDLMFVSVTPASLAFYSASLTALMVCFAINFAIKDKGGIFYTLMFFLALAYLFAADGGMAVFGFDSIQQRRIAVALAFLHITCSYHAAAISLDPHFRNPIVFRTFRLLMLASLATLPFVWLANGSGLAYLAVILMAGTGVAHTLTTRTWRRHDKKRQYFPVLVAIGGCALLSLFLTATLFDQGRNPVTSLEVLKVLFATIFAPTFMALILALADVRSARDAALLEALDAARKDAQSNAELLALEKQYSRAVIIAEARTRQITTASHDIRQPISAIRTEIESLKEAIATSSTGRLTRVLDHLDALTKNLSEAGSRPIETGLHGEVEREVFPIAILLDTLARLYGGRATETGIRLRFSKSRVSVKATPLIVIRIVGNLISNALEHAQASTVLVGVRRKNTRYRLDIIDNGRGLDDTSQASLFVSGSRGRESGGTGQGLAIVKELCDTYQLDLEIATTARQGTRFSVYMDPA